MSVSTRRELRRAILELGDSRYGWDSDKTLPARLDAIEFASTLFGPLGLWSTKELNRLPDYHVGLNQDGTIQIDFGNEGEKHLFLTFECAGVIRHVRVFEDGDTSIEGVIVLEHPEYEGRECLGDLLSFIGWLCQE